MKNFLKMKYRRNGQAMIEFALVLGVYFLLIGFMVSTFQMLYTKTVMNVAAYNAARIASAKYGTISEAKRDANVVLSNNSVAKNLTNYSVSVSKSGGYAVAEIKANAKLLFPVLDPSNPINAVRNKSLSTKVYIRLEK